MQLRSFETQLLIVNDSDLVHISYIEETHLVETQSLSRALLARHYTSGIVERLWQFLHVIRVLWRSIIVRGTDTSAMS